MDLSIVIINFNTKALTEQCIKSVDKSTRCDYEIIVVDNSTKPEEKYSSGNPKVRIINAENHGFGHACNIGMKASDADYYLMLNSDTIVHDGAIDTCLEYMKNHSDTGALGCKLLLADGTLDHACKRGLPTPSASFYYMTGIDKKHPESPKYARYRATYVDIDATAEVEVISGAFMMMSRKTVAEVGMFDEDFFMYGEDVDLCYRIGESGRKIIYLPESVVTHLKGQSGLSAKSPFVVRHFYQAMKIFYKKNFEKKYNFLVNAMVYLGINLKMTLALMQAKRQNKNN